MKCKKIAEVFKAETVYAVNIHVNSFRYKSAAEIIGLCMVTPDENLAPRLCYQIKYSDSFIDYVAVSEVDKQIKIVTFTEIAEGKLKDLFE